MTTPFDPTLAPAGYVAVRKYRGSCVGCCFCSATERCEWHEERACIPGARPDGCHAIFKKIGAEQVQEPNRIVTLTDLIEALERGYERAESKDWLALTIRADDDCLELIEALKKAQEATERYSSYDE